MRLCLIYNFAQHYRADIFSFIDREYDVDFLFGDSMGDVKKMDYSLLHGNIIETHTKRFKGGWSWQPKVVSQLFKEYDHYILLGDTHALSTWMFCILARTLKPQKKVYFWSHGWYGKETKLEKFLKKIMMRLPNGGVFCYGNYARNLMIKEGFNPDKLYTIHNSLSYDKQIELRKNLKNSAIFTEHFGNDNKNLIFIGRLTPVKKLDQCLKAVAICRNHGMNYNITFIGSGNMQEKLKSLTAELHLEHQVWFYGPCYDEQVLSSLIYNADLCVSPGNIGLTAIHSMVFGTPCITHNDFKYQMPEFESIKEGVTGAFFKRDDINSLAESIDDWFTAHSNKREEIRAACMKEIDEEWNPYFQINVLKKYMR